LSTVVLYTMIGDCDVLPSTYYEKRLQKTKVSNLGCKT
jgi:hypothetical protein